jgi:hypothetical protein
MPSTSSGSQMMSSSCGCWIFEMPSEIENSPPTENSTSATMKAQT